MNKFKTIFICLLLLSDMTLATQSLSVELKSPQLSPLQNQDIGRLTEFNRMLNAQHRLELSKLINKPENLIPQKYTGNDREEIKDLILKLQNVCPECGQVEGVRTGEFSIYKFPDIVFDRPPESTNNCAVPVWLKNKKDKLKSVVKGMGINIDNAGCDKTFISDLIDAL